MSQKSNGPNVALYRKHRPPAFDELVGQPAVVEGLSAAVKTGRVVHAYLFSGPRGTGKTSAARILAKCLNCLRGGPRPDPCGVCEACVSIAAGSAFDVIEIDAASNRGIDEIRELRERIKFAPAQFRTKVYIIDEVHMLTSEAFNALLKTLEEPPDYVVFVLATTEPHKVPTTILSRCQRYDFRRMLPTTIVARLQTVAAQEHIRITSGALARIAYLADGALRDALVLLEQARGFAADEQIDGATLERAFGASYAETIERIIDAILVGDVGAMFSATAQAINEGADPSWLAKELLRSFRLILMAQVSADLLVFEVPDDERERLARRAGQIKRPKVLTALRHLSECVAQRFSVQPRIDLELALARIALPAEYLDLQKLSDRLREVEEQLGLRPRPAPTNPQAAPAAAPAAATSPERASTKSDAQRRPQPAKRGEAGGAHAAAQEPAPPGNAKSRSLSAVKLQGLWQIILGALKERSRQCYGFLQHATIVAVSDDLVIIGVQSTFGRDSLNEPAMAQIVREALVEATGVRPAVKFQLSAKKVPDPAASDANGASSDFSLAQSVLGADLL
jgi:DNA polymerase-3 subunit gamma/tau